MGLAATSYEQDINRHAWRILDSISRHPHQMPRGDNLRRIARDWISGEARILRWDGKTEADVWYKVQQLLFSGVEREMYRRRRAWMKTARKKAEAERLLRKRYVIKRKGN